MCCCTRCWQEREPVKSWTINNENGPNRFGPFFITSDYVFTERSQRQLLSKTGFEACLDFEQMLRQTKRKLFKQLIMQLKLLLPGDHIN